MRGNEMRKSRGRKRCRDFERKTVRRKTRRETKERRESRLERCEVIASDTDGERTKQEGQRTEREREREMHQWEGTVEKMDEGERRLSSWQEATGRKGRAVMCRRGTDGVDKESQWSGWSHLSEKVLHHRRGHVSERHKERVVKRERVCISNLLFTPVLLLWLGAKKRPLLITISSTQGHINH